MSLNRIEQIKFYEAYQNLLKLIHKDIKDYKKELNNFLNNKIKLVKRNAYGYRYFDNLRKRILLHLNCEHKFV